MIINDSIKGVPTKRRELFSICREQYPKIVADIRSWEAPNIYWDNIITLMLLEMGVSDFLEKILCEEALFNSVLDNIAWRRFKENVSGGRGEDGRPAQAEQYGAGKKDVRKADPAAPHQNGVKGDEFQHRRRRQ